MTALLLWSGLICAAVMDLVCLACLVVLAHVAFLTPGTPYERHKLAWPVLLGCVGLCCWGAVVTIYLAAIYLAATYC